MVFETRDEQRCILQSRSQAPLKVQRPFFPEGAKVCHSVVMHTAGGIVGGDRLSFDIALHANAHAVITTAAAGKIYRTNGLEAHQSVQVEIAPNACLEWVPQETIVFNGALYRQEQRIELAPGAIWLGWDITRFGRTARGEQFVQGNWRSHTEVWQAGHPLWIDRQWLPGCDSLFHSPHGLAGCPVVGSLALVGQTVTPELVNEARDRWLRLVESDQFPSAEAGVTRLQSGLLCRYRGHSSLLARQWFVAVWQVLREQCLQRSLCVPRVWQ